MSHSKIYILIQWGVLTYLLYHAYQKSRHFSGDFNQTFPVKQLLREHDTLGSVIQVTHIVERSTKPRSILTEISVNFKFSLMIFS